MPETQDPIPVIRDILGMPEHWRRPVQVTHHFSRSNNGDSISAQCSCERWSAESAGTDEVSRRYVDAAFRAHAMAVGA